MDILRADRRFRTRWEKLGGWIAALCMGPWRVTRFTARISAFSPPHDAPPTRSSIFFGNFAFPFPSLSFFFFFPSFSWKGVGELDILDPTNYMLVPRRQWRQRKGLSLRSQATSRVR